MLADVGGRQETVNIPSSYFYVVFFAMETFYFPANSGKFQGPSHSKAFLGRSWNVPGTFLITKGCHPGRSGWAGHPATEI